MPFSLLQTAIHHFDSALKRLHAFRNGYHIMLSLFFLQNMIVADEDQALYDGTPRALFVDSNPGV